MERSARSHLAGNHPYGAKLLECIAWQQAAIREVTERAKKFHARLDAMGLKYRDLLELEVLAHSLGDMGHNILLGYERGEGWPSGT